jgi:hypothetical protein
MDSFGESIAQVAFEYPGKPIKPKELRENKL